MGTRQVDQRPVALLHVLLPLTGGPLFPALVGGHPQGGHRGSAYTPLVRRLSNQSASSCSAIVYSLVISCYLAIHPAKAHSLPSKSASPDGKRLSRHSSSLARSLCLQHGTGESFRRADRDPHVGNRTPVPRRLIGARTVFPCHRRKSAVSGQGRVPWFCE